MIGNEEKTYRKIIGSYIRYIRKDESMTLSFVGDILEINKGYLSKIENGETNITPEKLSKLTEIVDIKFVNDISLLNKSKRFLLELLETHISMNQTKIKIMLDSYFLNFSMCKDSPAFFHYLLIELYDKLEVKKDLKKSKELIKLLDEYFKDVFDSKEQLFFCLLKAFYYQYIYQTVTSLKYLKEAEDHYTGINNLNYLGVIYHRMAVMYFYLNDGFSSYIYGEKARMIFRDTLYFKRVQHLNVCIASSLVLLKKYQEAEEIYQKLLDNLEKEEKELKSLILNSLIWKSVRAREFENALTYINRAKEIADISYYMLEACEPIAHYYLGQKEIALDEINSKLNARASKDYIKLLLELLRSDIQDNNQTFSRLAKKVKRKIESDENFRFSDIYLQLILSHYERIDDKDKVIEVQDFIIHHYEK